VTKKPAAEDESRRMYMEHLCPRYCRVVRLLPGDAIEIASRDGRG
jgi:hypothetical protein